MFERIEYGDLPGTSATAVGAFGAVVRCSRTTGLLSGLSVAERLCAPAHCEERLVPRYFMHLIDSTDVLLDPDGSDMPRDAVERAALRAARDCMAGDVHNGRLDLRYRIDVHDESGTVVHRLMFPDALEVLAPEAGH
jgi:hypothetical protein